MVLRDWCNNSNQQTETSPSCDKLALMYPMYYIIATTNFNELLGIEVSKLLS